mgnify:CR=1 FL=1
METTTSLNRKLHVPTRESPRFNGGTDPLDYLLSDLRYGSLRVSLPDNTSHTWGEALE